MSDGTDLREDRVRSPAQWLRSRPRELWSDSGLEESRARSKVNDVGDRSMVTLCAFPFWIGAVEIVHWSKRIGVDSTIAIA